MNFNINKIFYTHLPPATFGNLSDTEIGRIFADGRYLSPFMEALAPKWFTNLSRKLESNFGDFIYSSGTDKSVEMRGFSSLGSVKKADLIPNYMIGKGRKYDEGEYIKALDNISGWMIVYPLVSYQDLLIFHYASSDALVTTKKRLGQKDIENILGVKPNMIHKWIKNQTFVVDNVMYEFDRPWKGKL